MLLAARPAAAQIEGTVRDAASNQPIGGAEVSVTDLDRAARTDSTGHYRLEGIPAGPHHLGIRLIGYAPHWLHVLVPREGPIEIDVALERSPVPLRAMEVHAPLILRGLDPGGEHTVFPDRASSIAAVRNHPLLSEPDALQAMEGGEVVVHPESPEGVHLMGGASDQTAYTLDGIPVFSPYHAAGLASAWNPDALSRLDLLSSTTTDQSTHALAGVIDGSTRQPGERATLQGSLSTTQMRLTLDGPLGGGGAGYLLSTRSGFAGLVTRKHEAASLDGETGDWLAKLETPLFGGKALALGYGNSNEIGATAVAESVTTGLVPRNQYEWHGVSLGGEWRRPLGGGEVRLAGWSATGDVAARWSRVTAPVDLAAARHDGGVRLGFERHAENRTSNAEVVVERIQTWYQVQPDSSPVPSWRLDGATPLLTVSAGQRSPIAPHATLSLGASLASSRSELYPDGRALLEWTAAPWLTLSAGWSRTHQFAQSLRNPESIVGHVFPADVYVGSGAPGVPVATGQLGLLAADVRPAAGLRLGLQAYTRTAEDLVLVAPRDGEPFSTGDFAIGSGQSWGASIEAAMTSARVGWLASYGFQRVRMSYGDSSYVPEAAVEHTIEGGAIYFPTASTVARIGVSAGLGRRTTIVPGTIEWESCNLLDRGCEFSGSPDYAGEQLGATSLPAYCRVDAGLRQHWHLSLGGRDETMALFVSFSNLLGRKNLLTYARNPAGRLIGIELRPTSPFVAGIDWRF